MKWQWSVTLNYCFTRALASIEAINRVKQSDMNQCSANLMPKTLQWQWFKIVRVPPLNIFRRSSWPIRGQDFWLSTNQKPRFQPDSEPPLKLNPSNPLSLCHWNVTQKIPRSIHIQSLPCHCQWIANSVPMQCHLKLLFYSGTCLYRGNWPSKTIWDEPMQCQWSANGVSLWIIVLLGHLPL